MNLKALIVCRISSVSRILNMTDILFVDMNVPRIPCVRIPEVGVMRVFLAHIRPYHPFPSFTHPARRHHPVELTRSSKRSHSKLFQALLELARSSRMSDRCSLNGKWRPRKANGGW